jgi:radical SAM superfamily enzyme YgiQ (UPF0313 family)
MREHDDIVFIYPKVKYFASKTPFPHLNIGYLGAILKGKGYSVRLIDGLILSKKKYESQIKQIKEGIVCISTLLIHLNEVKRICSIIKKRDPSIKIIIGGVGLKCVITEHLFDDFNADFFIIGEAEYSLPMLIDNLQNPEHIKLVEGVFFKKGKKVIFTKKPKEIKDLDEIPHPDRELINAKTYQELWKEIFGNSCTFMITSRGCPYSCIFCDHGYAGRHVRLHSSNYVVDEIQQIIEKYNPDELFINDDLFLIDKKRVKKICEELKRRKLDITWGIQARVDSIDREILQIIKKAGCVELVFGVETGSPRLLSFLNKGFTIDQVENAFRLCHEIGGINPGTFILVGIPGGTRKDIELTKKLISKIKPSHIMPSYLTPYPGTKIYDLLKDNIKNQDYSNWDDFQRTIIDYNFEVAPETEYNELIEYYYNSVVPTLQRVEPCFTKLFIENTNHKKE